MKPKKCVNCGEKIEKGKEAYFNSKVYCQLCFRKDEVRKTNSRHISSFWKKWLKQNVIKDTI